MLNHITHHLHCGCEHDAETIYTLASECLRNSTGPEFVKGTLATTLAQLERALKTTNERARQALDLTKDLNYSEGE